jgi:hypothetical protein
MWQVYTRPNSASDFFFRTKAERRSQFDVKIAIKNFTKIAKVIIVEILPIISMEKAIKIHTLCAKIIFWNTTKIIFISRNNQKKRGEEKMMEHYCFACQKFCGLKRLANHLVGICSLLYMFDLIHSFSLTNSATHYGTK